MPRGAVRLRRIGVSVCRGGLTLILVTHDSTVAGRAQRIGLMRDGRLEIKQDTEHAAS
jgi:predicted ABC-type transport system involved in lysophospholipase L1 biosynthesis ATPase subunit